MGSNRLSTDERAPVDAVTRLLDDLEDAVRRRVDALYEYGITSPQRAVAARDVERLRAAIIELLWRPSHTLEKPSK